MKKMKYKMNFLLTAIIMFLFWILISRNFDFLHLFLGVIFSNKRLTLMTMPLLLALILYLFPGQIRSSLAAENNLGPTINVQGTGYAFVTPDRARITLSVVTVTEAIQEAQKINANKVSKLRRFFHAG